MVAAARDWQPQVHALIDRYRASVAALDEQEALRIRGAIDDLLVAVRRAGLGEAEAREAGVWRALGRARDILDDALAH